MEPENSGVGPSENSGIASVEFWRWFSRVLALVPAISLALVQAIGLAGSGGRSGDRVALVPG